MKKFVTTGVLGLALLGAGAAGVCFTGGQCQAKTQSAAKTTEKAVPREIRWHSSLDEALAESKRTGKPILADFYATWCPPCQLMEKRTYPDAKVIAESQKWVMLKVDTDKEEELAVRYRISSLPTLAVLNAEGEPVTGAMGYLDAATFVKMLRETHDQAAG